MKSALFLALCMVSTLVMSGNVNISPNRDSCQDAIDRGCIGCCCEIYESPPPVTFSEVRINGNVCYLCSADRLATCQQNRQGYSNCQYYGNRIICR